MELEASRGLTRTWLHVDMDAFYAAVETLDNPALKGRPLAVGSLSMICTANYEVCNLSICSFYCFTINICGVCVLTLYIVLSLHIFVLLCLCLIEVTYYSFYKIANGLQNIFAVSGYFCPWILLTILF